jgi:hypothetical protein
LKLFRFLWRSYLKIEAVSLTGAFQRGGTIDEKHGPTDGIFLAEFIEVCVSNNVDSGRLKLSVKQLVSFWIDGSVQPVVLVVELYHGFTGRNVILPASILGL